VEGDANSEPNRSLAAAISNASYAVQANSEITDGSNYELVTEGIANDLRLNSSNVAADLIANANHISQEALVKEISIISNIERIADSIDESSPALREIEMPDEPAAQKIIQVSPIQQTQKLQGRILKATRKFLRR
jgi:hypothetical protein